MHRIYLVKYQMHISKTCNMELGKLALLDVFQRLSEITT